MGDGQDRGQGVGLDSTDAATGRNPTLAPFIPANEWWALALDALLLAGFGTWSLRRSERGR